VEGAEKKGIVAFTFTEAAAEELKFRIRAWLELMCLPGEDSTLGGMYVGTMHGFCLTALRDLAALAMLRESIATESVDLVLRTIAVVANRVAPWRAPGWPRKIFPVGAC
jgi:superfamily I DNA/RNA helicase